MSHHQAIGVGGAESSTTRYIGNTDKRTEVTWCLIVQKFARQRGQLELNAFSNTQPVEAAADEGVSDMKCNIATILGNRRRRKLSDKGSYQHFFFRLPAVITTIECTPAAKKLTAYAYDI